MKNYPLLFIANVIILCSCNSSFKKSETATDLSDPILAHIDSSFAPGQNFFYYANNNWFKQNPIPVSEKSNGIFRTVQDTVNESILKICTSALKDTQAIKGSNKQKIGDFYFSGLDTLSIENAGYSALKDQFMDIDAVKNTNGLIAAVCKLQAL